MKFIEHDGNFQIAPNDVQSYDVLPAGYYKINYNSNHDTFSLDRTNEFRLEDGKIYGAQIEKMNKVVRAYEASNRSLGVLLSGDKGIGKSLFAKLLCMTMFAKGKAIVIIDKSYKGLNRFLSELPGDTVYLFDEFDKVFNVSNSDESRDESDQESLLSLFDGIGTYKRLFIITCNDLSNISTCMLNRSGRFHYHIEFTYPTEQDIIKYMKDNVINYDQTEIYKVIKLSEFVPINYDTLRSIAFEFNLGEKFEEFIYDLNIKQDVQRIYKATATLENGTNKTYYTNELEPNKPLIISLYRLPTMACNICDISSGTPAVHAEKSKYILPGNTYQIQWGNSDNIDISKDIILEPYNEVRALSFLNY